MTNSVDSDQMPILAAFDWVYTVFPDLSVQIVRVNAVLLALVIRKRYNSRRLRTSLLVRDVHYVNTSTAKFQWLEQLWDHGDLFEIWVVRATEG